MSEVIDYYVEQYTDDAVRLVMYQPTSCELKTSIMSLAPEEKVIIVYAPLESRHWKFCSEMPEVLPRILFLESLTSLPVIIVEGKEWHDIGNFDVDHYFGSCFPEESAVSYKLFFLCVQRV
jgi:hypothetical protein